MYDLFLRMKKSIAVLTHPLYNFTELLTKNLPNYNIREIKYRGHGNRISSKLETLTEEGDIICLYYFNYILSLLLVVVFFAI